MRNCMVKDQDWMQEICSLVRQYHQQLELSPNVELINSFKNANVYLKDIRNQQWSVTDAGNASISISLYLLQYY